MAPRSLSCATDLIIHNTESKSEWQSLDETASLRQYGTTEG